MSRQPGAFQRLMRNPITVFLAASVVLVGIIFIATNALAGRAARSAALEEAESVTAAVATSAIQPRLRLKMLTKGAPSVIDKFVRQTGTQAAQEFVSFDIISDEGLIVYDSLDVGVVSRELVFDLTEAQRAVLDSGSTAYEYADTESLRSQARPGDETGLVKIYARIYASPGSVKRSEQLNRRGEVTMQPALMVAYWQLEGVENRRGEIFGSFRWITLGPLLLLVLISTLMLGVLTRQVRRGGLERERLLQAAIDASDAERRRIARDLHDGVVQDLAGSAFAISGAARDPEMPTASREVLTGAGASMRDSLKQMRSLLAEIHPPDLHGQGLQAALGDLLAPAATAGIQASTSVTGIDGASDAEVALVWRVAQEAVRNATRHSGASTLAVTVRGDAEQLLLEVVDDGVGFDPRAASAPDRFGLRGLRSLVQDVGGDLAVTSAVGEGTTVRMAVRR